MNVIFFILVILTFCTLAIIWRLNNGRIRHNRLRQMGKKVTWDQVEGQPMKYNKIAKVNFGQGNEMWALSGDDGEVDLEIRAFKQGLWCCQLQAVLK